MSASPSGARSTVELGILLAPSLHPETVELVRAVGARCERVLARTFSEFQWCVSVVVDHSGADARTDAAVELLDRAAALLEARHLDFVLYFSPVLPSRHIPSNLCTVISQLLGCGLVALPRGTPKRAVNESALVQRALAAIAALNGLSSRDLVVLNDRIELGRQQTAEFRAALVRVADERLEEQRSPRGALRFYLESVRINAGEIARAVGRSRPWLFPFRLSRLMIGAFSTGAVVMLTAEAWDLSSAQSPARLTVLTLGALLAAVLYLLRRQNLLSSLRARRLTERRVVAEVATCVGLVLGLTSTLAVLLLGTYAVAGAFYPADLIARWSLLGGERVGEAVLKASAFSAALALVVGGLGASFEAPQDFRFVIVVDQVLDDG